jgi:GH35 family endo-1,4-beta-xylanase
MVRRLGVIGVTALAFLCAAPAVSAGRPLVVPAPQADVKTVGAAFREAEMPESAWNLFSNGQIGFYVRVESPGKYRLVVGAAGTPAEDEWPQMAVVTDGRSGRMALVEGKAFKDYSFDVELSKGVHLVAVAFLNDLAVPKKDGTAGWAEDRNLFVIRMTLEAPADAVDPVRATEREYAEGQTMRERALLAELDARIDKVRKSDVTVRVVDAAGRPVPGAVVEVEQVRSQFLFGCNIYMFDRFPTKEENEAYKKAFAELFNYATVGFYWRWYEPQQGKPGYAYTDKVVDWCQQHGIAMKGHPLLWADEGGIPTWSKGQPSAELQKQRVSEIIGRYKGRIDRWEVVNEPAHLASIRINEPYRWAREADPKAYLIVNDYHVLADGCPPFLKLLTDALADKVPFDGIGIQAHEPRADRFPPDQVTAVLDTYAGLGKDLHITEFTPTSGGEKITGSASMDGVWNDETQAEYAVQFYRTCFAHPAVVAVTWWDLCDRGSWLKGGGMLRADLTPKPVYTALKKLIREDWCTRATGKTDGDGRFVFRGFLWPFAGFMRREWRW